jgi:hypothetical protein
MLRIRQREVGPESGPKAEFRRTMYRGAGLCLTLDRARPHIRLGFLWAGGADFDPNR